MKRIFQTPETAFPLALSLVLLALVGVVSTMALPEAEAFRGGGWLVVALATLGSVMAMYRSRRGLALASAVLAPTAFWRRKRLSCPRVSTPGRTSSRPCSPAGR